MFGNNLASRYPSRYIRQGDRIYVRIVQNNIKMYEFSVENVSDYTALIGEIRFAARDMSGLAKVFVRNHSRGWSEERPMMFYQGMPSQRRRAISARVRLGERKSRSGMLAPWETH